MEHEINNDRLKRYHELFSDETSKAMAFDRIAERFFAGNFGTMAKSDFEILLFDIYLERILEGGDEDFSKYSDYRLSKELGIPQSRVSNLKVKKQLQYPHEFLWRKSLEKISNRVRYENGKFKLQIPDINLYYEIKNAVEEAGGYIDITLTSQLLQISPEYFLDLLVAISEENDRDNLKKILREAYRKNCEDKDYLEAQPFGKQLQGFGKDVAANFIGSIAASGLPGVAILAQNAVSALLSIIRN